jgi:3'-5' exoribonuclease
MNNNHSHILNSSQPSIAEIESRMYFKGFFVLAGLRNKYDQDGNNYCILQITDSTGTIDLYCFLQEFQGLTNQLNPVVQVEVSKRQFKGKEYFRVKYIEIVPFHLLCRHVGLQGLPERLCPVPNTLPHLIDVVSRIANKEILSFVTNVIMQENVAFRYCACPASLNHHHNYSGGLLEHSLAVAHDLLLEKDLSCFERSIAVAVALLHDIGKVKTLTPDISRTAVGYLVDHQDLTLEICSHPLKILDETSPHSANQVRHILTCASPGSRYGFKAQLRVADRLQTADRTNARMTLIRPFRCTKNVNDNSRHNRLSQ